MQDIYINLYNILLFFLLQKLNNQEKNIYIYTHIYLRLSIELYLYPFFISLSLIGSEGNDR